MAVDSTIAIDTNKVRVMFEDSSGCCVIDFSASLAIDASQMVQRTPATTTDIADIHIEIIAIKVKLSILIYQNLLITTHPMI